MECDGCCCTLLSQRYRTVLSMVNLFIAVGGGAQFLHGADVWSSFTLCYVTVLCVGFSLVHSFSRISPTVIMWVFRVVNGLLLFCRCRGLVFWSSFLVQWYSWVWWGLSVSQVQRWWLCVECCALLSVIVLRA